MKVGNNQAMAIGEAIKCMNNKPSLLNLSNNNLNDKGVEIIIDNISDDTKIINLSDNKLTIKTIRLLTNIMENKVN